MTPFTEAAWSKNLEIPYFEKKPERKQGFWEYDLISHHLFWSKEQYQMYGYAPGELALNDDYFIKSTTHNSEIRRITGIVDNAIRKDDQYHFRRRIIKKSGSLGFVETNAIIIRSIAGKAKKVLGTTLDLSTPVEGQALDFNDPRFFNQLYTNFHKVIRYRISQFVTSRELVDDLCQEVFLKAWHHMSQYDPAKGELYTWLLRIAENHCKDHFKSRTFRSEKLTTSLLRELEEKSEDEVSVRDTVFVRELLFCLSLHHRELIDLLFVQGFTQSEVSKLKNIPLGTVKSRTRCALRLLRNFAQHLDQPSEGTQFKDPRVDIRLLKAN